MSATRFLRIHSYEELSPEAFPDVCGLRQAFRPFLQKFNETVFRSREIALLLRQSNASPTARDESFRVWQAAWIAQSLLKHKDMGHVFEEMEAAVKSVHAQTNLVVATAAFSAANVSRS